MNLIGTTSLTGAAGEYLVMSRLLSHGYIAALAPHGVPNMDIVVTSVDGTQLCAIQVKTRWDKGSDGGWHMGKKHENIFNPRMFYCFADLGKSAIDTPKVWVVPSTTVAKAIRESHQMWLSKPGKGGRVRNDSNVRRFLPDYTKIIGEASDLSAGWLDCYKEAWALLSPTEKVESQDNGLSSGFTR